MPLAGILADMELQGVTIDTEHLKSYSIELTKELDQIEQQARELAQDQSLNLSSPKQVGILIYEKLALNPKAKKSAKGNWSTDEETRSELADKHPIINKILEYRALKKLLSTYIDNFPSLICKETGKVHTTFNQTITATGRLSSANPNLQNIPIRTERGKEIRKAFIPSSTGGLIVSADYSQIELRLMAHMSGDKDLIAAFNSGKDIHTATAAKVFKVSEAEVTREQRSRAKTANFGIIYGISAFGLSQRLGMSRSDSKQLIEEYFKNYPGVKEYMDNMILKARETGYVETIYGRRRFLPDINSRNAAVRSFNERNAINAPLQGSAADIIKVAMINIYKRLKSENLVSKMVLQVHDELVFDVVAQEVEIIKNIVKEEMERVITLHIPLIAECNAGKNWLEAH
jgi:DNA polymerase-1